MRQGPKHASQHREREKEQAERKLNFVERKRKTPNTTFQQNDSLKDRAATCKEERLID